jgi:uncharacterized protein
VKLDLTELLRGVGNEADIEDVENVQFPEDQLKLSQPLKVLLHLVNTGNSVLINGKGETALEVACSRCLQPFSLPVSFEIKEEFVRQMPDNLSKRKHKSGEEIELRTGDFIYPIEADNTIDLTELLRQDLLLALPIKMLCKPDCQGLS